MKSNWLMGTAMACALAASATGAMAARSDDPLGPNGAVKHIVIIYQENHSFDNLYGNWGNVEGEAINGRANATPTDTTQVRQDGSTAYQCLLQLDVNLASPTPLATSCTDNNGATPINSAFTNTPFNIDAFIPSTDTTCPAPTVFAPTNGILNGQGLPGGCTRDLMHRYYSEIYQIDGGKQDLYVTGSDASGLSMGYYDSTQLPIWAYLHNPGAPHYVIADNFFQGAFGGSFLNHQWFIAAATPVFVNAPNDASANDLHSVVDTAGMPTNTPLYTSAQGFIKDAQLTASCNPPAGRPTTPAGVTCGDYAVNTIQPYAQPYSPGTAAAKRLPPLTNETIGDRLNEAGVKWAWYSGGWSNADGDIGAPGWTNGATSTDGCTDPNVNATAVWPNCPDGDFQFHHQAFNFFKNYGPGTKARKEHLRDEQEFISRANAGTLLPVSFIKPLGEDNEHPGYASEHAGSSHLVDLLNAIFNGPDGKDTLVIITYDEFGGQWDHVSPPGTGKTKGPHDKWGPGTRIPAILISKQFVHSGVDHVEHDTTSIAASLE
ncbi:MAG TPA: alkaline phosphatase family protein, partial [Rhizomicrobium sp.]|nr:alkaline phosphatase family protein [Rhizomicrobium sp.]